MDRVQVHAGDRWSQGTCVPAEVTSEQFAWSSTVSRVGQWACECRCVQRSEQQYSHKNWCSVDMGEQMTSENIGRHLS